VSRHYHVLCGLQGLYMPDTNDVCETWSEAVECASEHADGYAEDMECEATKHSDDYYTIGQFSVEIHECDAACEVDHD